MKAEASLCRMFADTLNDFAPRRLGATQNVQICTDSVEISPDFGCTFISGTEIEYFASTLAIDLAAHEFNLKVL